MSAIKAPGTIQRGHGESVQMSQRAECPALPSTWPALARIAAIAVTVLCGSLSFLALSPSTVLASRPFSGTITGFSGVFSVAIDNADNVWVTDDGQRSKINPGANGIYKYNPFPSQNQIAVPNTFGSLGFYVFDLTAAVDDATGEVFVAQSNGRQVYIFAPASESAQCKKEVGETVLLHP